MRNFKININPNQEPYKTIISAYYSVGTSFTFIKDAAGQLKSVRKIEVMFA